MAEFLDYDISAYPFSGFQIFWNVSSSIKRNLAIFGYIFTGFAMFKFGIWFINLKNVHVTHISFNTIDINLFLHLQKHCMKSVQIQSYFWSEYKKIRTRNNSVFGHFSRSESFMFQKFISKWQNDEFTNSNQDPMFSNDFSGILRNIILQGNFEVRFRQ